MFTCCHPCLAFLFGAVFVVLGSPAVLGYEAFDVEDGATITGTTVYRGDPKTIGTDISKDEKTCGKHVDTPIIEVDENGGLKNVVVFIEDIEEGAAVDESVNISLDNRNCRFEPHVQSMSVRQALSIINSDPVLHNTHAFLGKRTMFNIALPTQGQKISKRVKKPGLLHVKCDAGHTWMSAWVYVFEHPYHSVTDSSGRFTIGNVPPGTYRVTAWHEELGTQTLEVDLNPGATTEVTFDELAS